MRGKIHLTMAATLGLGVAGVGAAAIAEATPWMPGFTAQAVIKDVNGKQVGNVRVDPEGYAKSRVTVTVGDLPPGYHGFHIHTTGVCDPGSVDPATGSKFFSSGSHLDLGTPHKHGAHTGDLPSLLVGADGTGDASFVTDRFRVAQLNDADGSAIIIHASPDNFAHIPDRYTHPGDSTGTRGPDVSTRKVGDAGARIACGVIH